MAKLKKPSSFIIAPLLSIAFTNAFAMEFNTGMLDIDDTNNIDFNQFSQADFILPGQYYLITKLNNERISQAQNITIKAQEATKNIFQTVCIPVTLREKLGLKDEYDHSLKFYDDNQCIDLSSLEGASLKVDLSTLTMFISIPQLFLEYTDPNWVPPSLWEEGVDGALLDYSLNGTVTKRNTGSKEAYLSSNGTTGFNLNAWRLRADFQSSFQKSVGKISHQRTNALFSRLYAYRALPSLASTLTLGENYFYSSIFDAWQYTGLSLENDENMIPPKLAGYAPEIIGIAKTNATVIVKNHDRIIYEATVPAGPFQIRSLESSARGKLDVTVREENGEEHQFSITTAALPYLTRPRHVRYKFAMGKPRHSGRELYGDITTSGEISYGLTNYLSLYGGTILSKHYQAVSAGFGRDLSILGSLSFDTTQAYAQLSEKRLEGRSYRVSYSKPFNEARLDINFAGYRFSDETYRTLQQTLDERRTGTTGPTQKNSYRININKYFDHFSFGGNYHYSTYWRGSAESQYSSYLNTSFDFPVMNIKNMGITASATRSVRPNYKDDAINLSISIPLQMGSHLSFSHSYSKNSTGERHASHNISYNHFQDDRSYNLNVGYQNSANHKQSNFSGYISQSTPYASLSANASYVPSQYYSFGGSINGGITLIGKGVAFHPSSYGGTRLVIETANTAHVPLNEGNYKTNRFGLAVIPNVSNYRKISASINTSKLPANIDALDTVTDHVTLTRGAIGLRSMNVVRGQKVFVRLKLNNGSYPPFGASVRNKNNHELGIVGDQGVTWIVGVDPQESLDIYWNNKQRCRLEIPQFVDANDENLTFHCL